MKKILFLISLFITCAACAYAHGTITGIVLDEQGQALIGANVYWANTGKGTITNTDGKFFIEPTKETHLLVSSYMGYHNDTTQVAEHQHTALTIVLVSDLILDEVTIRERKASVVKSRISAFDTQMMGADEICKAACCNLSEAFETNASVDVAYADAATGAKQIRLLGLSGTYVQLLSENTPGVRGLAQNYGMEYIPGPWMAGIQVSKGTSSVINGYEATTGQINVEFLKPQTQDPIAINAMINSELMAEVNVEGGWMFKHRAPEKGKLYTGIMAHYQNGMHAMDDNGDGFADMPKSHNVNIANRWFFKKNQYTLQAYARGLYDQRDGGQLSMHKTTDANGEQTIVHVTDPYHIGLRTWRVDGFVKNGIVFDEETGMSLGIIAAGSYHDQQNRYGKRQWEASQANGYLNAIFQNNFEGSERVGMDNDHRLSAGLSVNFDQYREGLVGANTQVLSDTLRFDRWELTPGVFAEYSLKLEDMLSLVAGVRADYSTRYGFFITPRVNVRYSPWEWWSIRASAGLGYRSPNVLADNAFAMPSSREMHFCTMPQGGVVSTGYNDFAHQERAINTGVSTTFYIPIAGRELQLSAEYYYTGFLECVIADMDQATHQLHFYNLSDIKQMTGTSGRSFAHNAQVEASMEILRGWTMTAAFRYTDVEQTTIDGEGKARLREKPLSKKYKGVITTSYQTPLKKWQFDVTAQFNGGGRMPDGFNDYFLDQSKPERMKQYEQKADGSLYYKWYPQLMAQITKYFRTCSLYLGAENMTNFKQQNPVIAADQPYSVVSATNPYAFDASMAWGPITGWKVYLGFRWSITKED
ncbi:MAG: TonB-dependent receptor [Paludibacteraceae bacterium]|nr:TonB-dependent receptor [Paludibacteraceae bacterium]